MKTIIAGSRNINNYNVLLKAISASGFNITEVVCGMARGVDMMGWKFADNNKLPIAKFPADWNKYDKRAGYLRNEQMAKYADALIAIWDGESKGTLHMINLANKMNLKVFVYKYGRYDEHGSQAIC